MIIESHCSRGLKPINVHPYRYPHFQKNKIYWLENEMLDEGVIHHSISPYSLSVLLVKKKDDTWWYCINYWVLNAFTVCDQFSILPWMSYWMNYMEHQCFPCWICRVATTKLAYPLPICKRPDSEHITTITNLSCCHLETMICIFQSILHKLVVIFLWHSDIYIDGQRRRKWIMCHQTLPS